MGQTKTVQLLHKFLAAKRPGTTPNPIVRTLLPFVNNRFRFILGPLDPIAFTPLDVMPAEHREILTEFQNWVNETFPGLPRIETSAGGGDPQQSGVVQQGEGEAMLREMEHKQQLEAKRAQEAEAKRMEVETQAKLVHEDAKRAEAEALKARAEALKAREEAVKAEAEAVKAEAETQKAMAELAKAEAEAKTLELQEAAERLRNRKRPREEEQPDAELPKRASVDPVPASSSALVPVATRVANAGENKSFFECSLEASSLVADMLIGAFMSPPNPKTAKRTAP
jgi:hypothetical protein